MPCLVAKHHMLSRTAPRQCLELPNEMRLISKAVGICRLTPAAAVRHCVECGGKPFDAGKHFGPDPYATIEEVMNAALRQTQLGSQSRYSCALHQLGRQCPASSSSLGRD
jgi:hypothetical protein